MNETKKRKEWIKNFAIIFLAILLVLTFCSNTIMNYSLPEVAAQYCYSGEITNKVRGNGTVEAEDPYKVIFKQSRKVDSVVARVGDMVEKGDVLYKLEEGDSEELKELKKQLEEYLIKNELSDAYAGVVDGKKDSDFEANLEKVKAARKKVENLEKAVANTEAALEKFKNGTAEQYAEYKALADAKATKQAWDTQHGYNSTNLEAAKATFNYDTLKSAYDVALNDYNMAKADYDAKVAAEATAQAEKDAAQAAITALGASFDPTNVPEHQALQDTLDAKNTALTAASNAKTAAQTTMNTKKDDLDTATANFKVAENGVASYMTAYNTSTAKTAEMERAVADAEKAIENKTAALQKQVDSNKKALEDANTELTRLVSDVEVLAPILQKIKDLESEGGELTITAPVSGTVLSLNYAAGQTIETGAEVASIQVAGRGYTMSLTVPSEKAALVAIGDEAEISNSWWYVNVHARVKSIKNNPQNPGKEKIILFELEGDVSAGQSLSVTVGQRTATYDTIVPSSAIRSDDNGKFVLRVNTKSTPLGNRYIAERVDVTVLAEDETRTAVSGEFTGWDYIITTVTKPVEDGQQVRLKD